LHPLSVPPLIMAAINFFVGAYYLAFYIKRMQIREHLPFALLCLSVSLYDIFCVYLYNSGSIHEGIFWQRLQLDTIIPISIFLMWFISVFTGQKKNPIIQSLIALFIIIFFTSFFIGPEYTLSTLRPEIKNIHSGYLPDITYFEGAFGLLYQVEIIIAIITYFYLIYLIIGFYRKKGEKLILLIGTCLVSYLLAVINDSSVAMGAYPFIYVSEYIFLLIIISMAYILLDRFINLNKAYEELNQSLEQKVVERTDEILKSQAQVKQLEGIIPICMYCKKIRDDTESWHQLEKYISDHSDAQFSHSICPACYERVSLNLEK
jgi:hypothetical protein